jgi:hypothetical protein
MGSNVAQRSILSRLICALYSSSWLVTGRPAQASAKRRSSAIAIAERKQARIAYRARLTVKSEVMGAGSEDFDRM